MIKSRSFFLFLFIFCILLNLFPDENIIFQAEELISLNKLGDAKIVIKEWLLENENSTDFKSVFLFYLKIEDSIIGLRTFITALLQNIQTNSIKYFILTEKANLELLLGNTEYAQNDFQKAAEYATSSIDKSFSYLESARLLFEEGFLDEAKSNLLLIFQLTQDKNILSQAYCLKGDIERYVGDIDTAEEIYLSILTNYPGTTGEIDALLTLVFIYRENEEKSSLFLKQLESIAPNSPEYQLASKLIHRELSDIDFLLTPQRFFELYYEKDQESDTAENIIYVQTGSFYMKENAEYMIKDLESLGFKAMILEIINENKILYKVVIGEFLLIDEAQTTLIKLKDAGFEGFILYQ